jgi:ParB family chromosome partitioning protein
MTVTQSKLVKQAIAARQRAEKAEGVASPARWDEADCYAEMSSDGWSVRRIAKECETNKSSVAVFIAAVSRYPDSDTRPLFWEAYAECTGEKTDAQRIVASDENEWYTPVKYIKAARKVLGRIDLDPASCPEANKTVRARTIYTSEDNGMEQPWFGAVWLNPPYGRLAGQFIQRLVLEYQGDFIESAIALVNAHCTDTEWFQMLWDHPLCFTDHRIDFNSNGREKKTTSTHGSVFAYLGQDVAAFKLQFEKFGHIVRKI